MKNTMKITLLSILISIVILFIGYKLKEDNTTKPTIHVYNAIEKEAFSDEYVLEKEPLFTSNEIASYNWDTHKIVFDKKAISKQKELYNEAKREIKKNKVSQDNNNSENVLTLTFHKESKTREKIKIGGSTYFNTNSRDKFYVYVDDELIYTGYYNQSLYSSFLPIGAVMVDNPDGVSIQFRSIDDVEDKRSDSRIYNALKSLGKLKEK